MSFVSLWHYPAKFQRAVDGDTVDLTVDLGFKVYMNLRVRLLGVDTPERGETGYMEATRFTENWFLDLGPELECILETKKSGKYGRWLALIYDADGNTLNDALLDAGMAEPYKTR